MSVLVVLPSDEVVVLTDEEGRALRLLLAHFPGSALIGDELHEDDGPP